MLGPLIARARDGVVARRVTGDKGDGGRGAGAAQGRLRAIMGLVDRYAGAGRIGVNRRIRAGGDQPVDDGDLADAGVHPGLRARIDAIDDEIEPGLVVDADIAEAAIDLDAAERVRADDLAVEQHRAAARGGVDVGHHQPVVDKVVGDRNSARGRPTAAEDTGQAHCRVAGIEPGLTGAAQDVADVPADIARPVGDPACLDRGVDVDRRRLDRDLRAVDLRAAALRDRIALPVGRNRRDDHEADVVAHVIAAGTVVASVADISDAVAIELHREVADRSLVLPAVKEVVQVGRALARSERVGRGDDRFIGVEAGRARPAARIVDVGAVLGLRRGAGCVHAVRPVRRDRDRAVRHGGVELQRVDALAGEAE